MITEPSFNICVLHSLPAQTLPLTLVLFPLSNLTLANPPLLSLLTPHRSRAEFTFFTNPLSSATKTLSSPDQNRPVDTSSRIPEHSLTSSAPLIGSLRGKRCCIGDTRAGGKSCITKFSGFVECRPP